MAVCHGNGLQRQTAIDPGILWIYSFMQYCKYHKLSGTRVVRFKFKGRAGQPAKEGTYSPLPAAMIRGSGDELCLLCPVHDPW